MNSRLKKIVILTILLFIFHSCKCNKGNIDVINTKINHPVILRLSKTYLKIFRVKIPTKIILKNNLTRKKEFVNFKYNYGSTKNKGIIEFVFKETENKLIEIDNDSKKTIHPYDEKEFIIYSSHKVDSTKLTQQQFKPYIEKMLAENKDTLHIGTVAEFAKKHKALFETLTKNDSISVQFLDGDKFGERITVPVKW